MNRRPSGWVVTNCCMGLVGKRVFVKLLFTHRRKRGRTSTVTSPFALVASVAGLERTRVRRRDGGEWAEGRYLCQSLSLGILHEGDLNWARGFPAAPAAWGLGGHGGWGGKRCSGVHRGGRGERVRW